MTQPILTDNPGNCPSLQRDQPRWSPIPTVLAVLLLVGLLAAAAAEERSSRDLNLIPFPKELVLGPSSFPLPRGGQPLVLTLTDADAVAADAAALQERVRVSHGLDIHIAEGKADATAAWLTLGSAPSDGQPPEIDVPLPGDGWGEAYVLRVNAEGIAATGRGSRALANALRTVTQLVGANAADGVVPAVTIRDWPVLRYRGFQDDMTRGPSSRLSFLHDQVRIGASVKANLFTYYMEHQFAFTKHPIIGLPEDDGGLGPAELRALVAYAGDRHMHVAGCQQSFGHFGHILKHPEYAHLRETGGVVNPTDERTYDLLNDLYSEQAPHVPFELFNVCCDETYGLGTGPAKEVADRDGVGAVYARHLARVHALLKSNSTLR